MINIKELRLLAQDFKLAGSPMLLQTTQMGELLDRLEEAEKEREMDEGRIADLMADLNRVGHENDKLRTNLETERMRLAACGVVALANTTDSAAKARDMRPEYWSASCEDVARIVDQNIELRAKIARMEQQAPVGKFIRHPSNGLWEQDGYGDNPDANPLYALPGAQSQPTASVPDGQSQAVIDVVTERRRQIEKEGWVPEHDDEHDNGELALVAAAYAISSTERNSSLSMASKVFSLTGWDSPWWKPHAPRPDLVRAGALILAEIERLDRATAPKPEARP